MPPVVRGAMVRAKVLRRELRIVDEVQKRLAVRRDVPRAVARAKTSPGA